MSDNQVVLRGVGLVTNPGSSGEPGQDGLAVAENIVLARPGIWEPRRGMARVWTYDTNLTGVAVFGNRLVVQTQAGQLHSGDLSTEPPTFTYVGYTNLIEDEFFRTAQLAKSLFILGRGAVWVMDSETAAPQLAGAVRGLDCKGVVAAGTGAAVEEDTQVAYRVVFGRRDATGRLILGAPSGRGVVRVPAGTGIFRNVLVSAAIPKDLHQGSFAQFYRSISTVNVNVPASDELFLARETPLPDPSATVLYISRSATTVTAITEGAHGLWAGCEFYLPSGLAGNAGTVVVSGIPDAGAYSTDSGVTWTSQSARLLDVAYGPRFSGIGYYSNGAYWSDDGITWASVTGLGDPGTSNYLLSIAYGSSKFVAVGASPVLYERPGYPGSYLISEYLPACARSADGKVYTSHNDSLPIDVPVRVARFGDRFVLLGWNRSQRCLHTATSTDGVTWSAGAPVTDAIIHDADSYAGDPGAQSILVYGTYPTGQLADGKASILSADGQTYALAHLWSDVSGRSDGPGALPRSSGQVLLKQAQDSSGQPGGAMRRTSIAARANTWYRVFLDTEGWEQAQGGHTGRVRVLVGTEAYLAAPDKSSPLLDATTSVALHKSTRLQFDFYSGDNTTLVLQVENVTEGTYYATGGIPRPVLVDYLFMVPLVVGPEAIHVASNGAGHYLAVARGKKYSSADGLSWSLVPGEAAEIQSLYFSKTRGQYFAGTNTSFIYSSNDLGKTWTKEGFWPGGVNDFTEIGPQLVAVGGFGVATLTGNTWAKRTVPGGTYLCAATSDPTTISPGVYTVTSPAAHSTSSSSLTFETAASGTIASTLARQNIVPLSVGILDNVPDNDLGTSLYTNQDMEGIANSHEQPPDSVDVCEFKGHAIYAQPLRPAAKVIQILKAGGTVGVQPGDSFTVNGGWHFFAREAENIPNREFALVAGDPYLTAQSLCRVINRHSSAYGFRALPTGSPGLPGAGGFILLSTDVFQSVTASTRYSYDAWAGVGAADTTEVPAREKNVLAISVPLVPDAVPLLNTIAVGRKDAAILRLVPLREAVLVWKEDGLFRLVGNSIDDFAVEPVDYTAQLVAPQSCAVLSNVCIALTAAGIQAATDAQVVDVSTDIRNQVNELLRPDMLAGPLKKYAVGVAYESDNSYTLWAPTLATDTVATRGWTYNELTQSWFARTDGFRHVVRRPADDRLWGVKDYSLFRERKSFSITDYADDVTDTTTISSVLSGSSQVVVSAVTNMAVGDMLVQNVDVYSTILAIDNGTKTLTLDFVDGFTAGSTVNCYRAIPCRIGWRPVYSPGDPSQSVHAREVGLAFRDCRLTDASVDFSSDLSPESGTVPLSYSDLGLVVSRDNVERPRNVRVLVTPEHQRNTKLFVGFTHLNAWRPFKLESLSMTYRPVGQRGTR